MAHASGVGKAGLRAGRGRWLVFAAAFFWGTSATLARALFRDQHVPVFTVVALRLTLSVVLLGVWLAWRRRGAFRVHGADWRYFVILGLFGVAAIQGSYYYSISVLGVGLPILIQYLAPALIVAYQVLRGARIEARIVVAVLAALAGTALLVGNIDPTAFRAKPLQWVVSFSSAFFFAFYILYSKHGLRRYAPETVLFYTFLVAGAFWMIATSPWRIIEAGYSPALWGAFLLLAISSVLVPFACFYAGLRSMGASEASIIATLEPVIAILSAALFLGEGLGAWQWAGAMLVLGASILATVAEEATQK